MRIIDKNKDFYDYCQNIYPDDLVTFDRRDSYNLTKEEFAKNFRVESVSGKYKIVEKANFEATKFILLQVGSTFWLFKMVVTDLDRLPYSIQYAKDYDLFLLDKWKDYDLPAVDIELSHVQFGYGVFSWRSSEVDEKVIGAMKLAIHTNDFLKPKRIFDRFAVYIGEKKEIKRIPILKNIGIAALVNPEDVYFALDEYFSKQITDSERIESVGITDKERVVNHGFDAKTSFRGKNK